MEDQAQHRCQLCGERLLRIIQPSALRFTGNGFYTTDYKAKK
jgi:predicted nucleic acid-binding Zn ribbon protein